MAKKKRGRPMKYKSADALFEAVSGYFDSISYTETVMKTRDEPMRGDNGSEIRRRVYVTPPGRVAMCLAIGIDTSTWDNYSDPELHPEFADVTRWAKMMIEAYLEGEVNTRDRPQGVMFNLEYNYGWKNRREVSVDATVSGKFSQISEISMDEKMRMIAEAAQEITAGGFVGGDDGGSEGEKAADP